MTIRLHIPMRYTRPCSACGRPLDWYETPKGKLMPMNHGAKRYEAADVLFGATPPTMAEFDAVDAHWATCPAGKDFKRRKDGR